MGQSSFYHATVALFLQIEICSLDRTKSSSLATSSYEKLIFAKNWVTTYKVLLPHRRYALWNSEIRMGLIHSGYVKYIVLKGKFSSGIEGALASTLNHDFNWKQLSEMILCIFLLIFFKVYLSNIDSETAEI